MLSFQKDQKRQQRLGATYDQQHQGSWLCVRGSLMELLNKTGSASYLIGFAVLYGVLVASFVPALAFVLTLLVMVVGMVLLNQG